MVIIIHIYKNAVIFNTYFLPWLEYMTRFLNISAAVKRMLLVTGPSFSCNNDIINENDEHHSTINYNFFKNCDYFKIIHYLKQHSEKKKFNSTYHRISLINNFKCMSFYCMERSIGGISRMRWWGLWNRDISLTHCSNLLSSYS